MRYLNIVLGALMVLFMGVQYNDPDGLVWMLIYAIPAIASAVAAWRPGRLISGWPQVALLTAIAASFAATMHFWPSTPRWWTSEVWYEVETAREGMGMMIVTIVLVTAWASARIRGMRSSRAPQT